MPERCLICGTYSRGTTCARCGASLQDEVDTSAWDVVERTTVSDDAGVEAIVGASLDGEGLSLAVAAAIDAANHGTTEEAERAEALARAAASAIVRREREEAMRAAMLRDEVVNLPDAG
ncbi:MAG TPA: hypothetical protein VMV18_12860, partial [bacterium]|nr:hypothetical protein [bacterium]